MEKQNFQNHRKFKPETRPHKIYYLIVVLLNILAFVNLCRAVYVANGRIDAGLIELTGIALFFAYFLFRSFSLKAQDRAIRAEENLRHFVLTGKLLDKSLSISQIIALRFAPDEEFIALVERAVKENLSNMDIKKAIKSWKEDTYRV
jgi:Family of unknown function (DUF6526)